MRKLQNEKTSKCNNYFVFFVTKNCVFFGRSPSPVVVCFMLCFNFLGVGCFQQRRRPRSRRPCPPVAVVHRRPRRPLVLCIFAIWWIFFGMVFFVAEARINTQKTPVPAPIPGRCRCRRRRSSHRLPADCVPRRRAAWDSFFLWLHKFWQKITQSFDTVFVLFVLLIVFWGGFLCSGVFRHCRRRARRHRHSPSPLPTPSSPVPSPSP